MLLSTLTFFPSTLPIQEENNGVASGDALCHSMALFLWKSISQILPSPHLLVSIEGGCAKYVKLIFQTLLEVIPCTLAFPLFSVLFTLRCRTHSFLIQSCFALCVFSTLGV